jgi:hypothetical protein
MMMMMMMMMSNELLDLDVSDILTTVAIKNIVLWDVTLRWLLVDVYRRLRIPKM